MSVALSLILCSRNDRYMGNSLWRLETTLNYAAASIAACGRLEAVELLVADWGSDVPLRDTVRLSADAASITSFLTVPPAVARPLQQDSPFPEVLALNAAAKRAMGTYVGRIDQDTLVGERFVRAFFDVHEGRAQLQQGTTATTLFYSNRREIPYRFAVQCPPLRQVERFVDLFRKRLKVLRVPGRPYWTYWVGVWLLHRELWDECGGYDERMLYYNWMEVDMIARLSTKYPLVDLSTIVHEYDFYHLEHVHPHTRTLRHGRKNPDMDWNASPSTFNPSGSGWGLASLALDVTKARDSRLAQGRSWLPLAWRVAATGAWIVADAVINTAISEGTRWRGRAQRALAALADEPVSTWPRVIARLWASRKR